MSHPPKMKVDAILEPDLSAGSLDPQDPPADLAAGGDPPPDGGDPRPDPEVVVIAVRPAPEPGSPVLVDPVDHALLAQWGIDLARRLVRVGATGARSEVTWIDLERDQPRAVLALGLGSGSPADLRRSGAAAVRRLRGVGEVLVLAARHLDAVERRDA